MNSSATVQPPSNPLPLSLIVVARNEEGKLPGCLASCAGYVSEILVGDMGSTDRTAEIARDAGATVYPLREQGFADPARQYMTEQASQPWTLMLDADERATPALFAQISQWIANPALAGVALPRKNYLFGRWLRYSQYWPDRQLRLYQTGSITWTPHVHTAPEPDGQVLEAPADPAIALVHLNYDDLEQWFEKANRYTTHEVNSPRSRSRPFRRRDVVLRPVAHFAHRYLLGRGFRDGRQGLWVAILMAIYSMQVELKRWEQAAGTGSRTPESHQPSTEVSDRSSR